jgi:hypothetical protein
MNISGTDSNNKLSVSIPHGVERTEVSTIQIGAIKD